MLEGGRLQPIPNSRFDAERGVLSFTVGSSGSFVPDFAPAAFTDTGHLGWAQKPLDALAARGIIAGTGASRFGPASEMKRADFILMLSRLFEWQPVSSDAGFKDVDAAAYYAAALSAARKLGIAAGDGVSFRPAASVTREEMMTLLYRAMQAHGIRLQPGSADALNAFADSGRMSGYAQEAMQSLLGMGIVQGSGGKLRPEEKATRAEAVRLLYGALEQLGHS